MGNKNNSELLAGAVVNLIQSGINAGYLASQFKNKKRKKRRKALSNAQ
ncbi:hypothetical protein [Flavobacterium sp. ZS1P14]